jgi:hypothetical protein
VAAPKATPAAKNTAAPKNNPNKKRKVTKADKNCPEELKKYTCVLRAKVTSVGASICRLVAQTLHQGHQQSA